MRTFFGFLAGADSMGMLVAHFNRNGSAFMFFGGAFMVAFYALLFTQESK